MGSGSAGKVTRGAWIIGNFYGTFIRLEAGFSVKRQRCGMVEGAGMQPNAFRLVLPCQGETVLKQSVSGALADEPGVTPKNDNSISGKLRRSNSSRPWSVPAWESAKISTAGS